MHSADVGAPAVAAKPRPAHKPPGGRTAASAPPAVTPIAPSIMQAAAATRMRLRAVIRTSYGRRCVKHAEPGAQDQPPAKSISLRNLLEAGERRLNRLGYPAPASVASGQPVVELGGDDALTTHALG